MSGHTKDIAVWFSCGAASAAAAKLTIERYGANRVHVLNNPVVQEDPDNQRFLADVEAWLGVTVERVTHSKYPTGDAVRVWDDRGFMSGIHSASEGGRYGRPD